MHTLALKAFETWLQQKGMQPEQIAEEMLQFRSLLDPKLG